MSWRTWVSNNPFAGNPDWPDFTLLDSGSLQELAKVAAWQMPARARSDDPALLMEFLELLEWEYAMRPGEFWTITLNDRPQGIEHPTWEEVEEYLGVKRKAGVYEDHN